jgi:hypothetical protein
MATKQLTRPQKSQRRSKAPEAVAPEADAVEVAAPAPTKKEMAQAETRRMHAGVTPSSFRIGKTLTPLRHDYRAGQMTSKDHGFLHDCINFAAPDGTFPRLNAVAGRLGRLYTMQFVTFAETGVYDENQTIALTDKAREYVKPVRAAA